ncbi:MAG TPA: glycosyltransferase [Chitinophagaceae bacterium]|nr:glycosyltransferase [Chitinophagaceae bacterium]
MLRKITNAVLYRTDKWRPPVSLKNGGTKSALLSYILTPFRGNSRVLHSSAVEAIEMADALAELGFNVDGVDYRYQGKIDYNKYDLVIGFGYPFRQSLVSLKEGAKRICYLTGASPGYSNLAEATRVKYLYQRKGVVVSPQREVYWPWVNSVVNADALMIIGNEWTKSTYQGIHENIFTLPVPFIAHARPISSDLDNTNGFVWFSGPGAVHKGLDLILDAIQLDQNNVMLDICGNISKEKDFCNSYRNEIFDNRQVSYMGMIGPETEQMDKVIARNSFTILPTCSEGTASSVITCMASGLIPVVTKESGVNLQGFGIEIKKATPASVREAMIEASSLPADEILRQRRKVSEYVHANHSPAAFKQQFKQALTTVIES